MNTSTIISYIGGYIVNPLIWLFILIFAVGGILLALWIRKKRNLKYQAIEIADFGTGKFGFNILKCGWFGINSYLRNLWWSGRLIMKTDSNEEIVNFSENDFQEINNKRGVIFYRDPISGTLVPINKLKIEGKEFLASIPPGEYFDAAKRIDEHTAAETTDFKQKVIQFIAWALVIVFSLLAIIFVINFIKNSQTEASKLILEAGNICLESAKSICSDLAGKAASSTAGVAP